MYYYGFKLHLLHLLAFRRKGTLPLPKKYFSAASEGDLAIIKKLNYLRLKAEGFMFG